jgi:hypothetical protein
VLTATVASFFVEEKQDAATDRLTAMEDRLERIEGLLTQLTGRSMPNGDIVDAIEPSGSS